MSNSGSIRVLGAFSFFLSFILFTKSYYRYTTFMGTTMTINSTSTIATAATAVAPATAASMAVAPAVALAATASATAAGGAQDVSRLEPLVSFIYIYILIH